MVKIDVGKEDFVASLELGVKLRVKNAKNQFSNQQEEESITVDSPSSPESFDYSVYEEVNSNEGYVFDDEKPFHHQQSLVVGQLFKEGVNFENDDDEGFDFDSMNEEDDEEDEFILDYGEDDEDDEFDMGGEDEDDEEDEFDMGDDEEEFDLADEEDEDDYDMGGDDEDEEEDEFDMGDDEEEFDLDDEEDEDDYDMGREDEDEEEEYEFDMGDDEEEFDLDDEEDEDEFDMGVDDEEDDDDGFDMSGDDESEDEDEFNMGYDEDEDASETSLVIEDVEPQKVVQVRELKKEEKPIFTSQPSDSNYQTQSTRVSPVIESYPQPQNKVEVRVESTIVEETKNSNVVFYKGMKLDEFLRENPTIRAEKDVLEYFHKDECNAFIRHGKVQYNSKKRRFFI